MSSLSHRFVHGNFQAAPVLPSSTDLQVGAPARQRELLDLARAQVAISAETLHVFEAKSEQLATVMRNEIERQSNMLVDAIQQGAGEMAAAVDRLGTRLSMELVGIRWELYQTRKIGEQVLEVLRRPRSTEAKELLQQGIRNLVNDKIDQARERLLLAFSRDNTDYQVLMNLSAVELRLGNADKAIEYVRDALTLPEDLDDLARAEALWWLARLHYTLEEYEIAAKIAQKSLELHVEPKRMLQYGCYRALSTDGVEGFDTIREAIKKDPDVFALAALSPDLRRFPDRLQDLLAVLAASAVSAVRDLHAYLVETLESSQHMKFVPRELEDRLRSAVSAARKIVEDPAYSDAAIMAQRAPQLRGTLKLLRNANIAGEELAKRRRSLHELDARLSKIKAIYRRIERWAPKSSDDAAGVGCGLIVMFFLTYLGASYVGAFLADRFGAGELSDYVSWEISCSLVLIVVVALTVNWLAYLQLEWMMERLEREREPLARDVQNAVRLCTNAVGSARRALEV